MDLETMGQIQESKHSITGAQLPLDAEGRELAERKRYSIDLPEHIVKTDPLR